MEKRERRLLMALGVIVVAGAADFAINTDDYLKYYGDDKAPVKQKATNSQQKQKTVVNDSKLMAYTDWEKDPFYDSSMRVKKKVYRPIVQEISFSLSAISFSEGKSVAMINSEVVTVGDRIQGFTVKSIQPKQVVLEKDGQTKTLKLQ